MSRLLARCGTLLEDLEGTLLNSSFSNLAQEKRLELKLMEFMNEIKGTS